MKNKLSRSFLFVLLIMTVALLLSLTAFAEKQTSGYMLNDKKEETNIKWSVADGTVTFEIDPTATDKVQTTVLYGIDPLTKKEGAWDFCPTAWDTATKAVIGDGITSIGYIDAEGKSKCGGLFTDSKYLTTVEIPSSLTYIGRTCFECSGKITSVYVKGTTPVEGTFDLSYITGMGDYVFDGLTTTKIVKFNPDFKGDFGVKLFCGTLAAELEVPAGVTTIKGECFSRAEKLKVLTILGMETVISGDNVFSGNSTFPAIKAPAGSKAEEFAKANGYTFINLATGEKTEGTKATTGTQSSSTTTTTPTTPTQSTGNAVPDEDKFNPEGATDYGKLDAVYNGKRIVNTYWAYYEETKTLKFVADVMGTHNETGNQDMGENDSKTWSRYNADIDYIEIGPYISKLSGKAFYGMSSVKEIKLGKNVTQMDYWALVGCSSLDTLWKEGGERVEGTGDFSFLSEIVRPDADFANAAFDTIIFGPKIRDLTGVVFNEKMTTIVSPNVDELDAYCREHYIDLVDANDPTNVREYAIKFDESIYTWIGKRCAYRFDEATGTIYIDGAGDMKDIINYYGGGSKTQWWFEIKNQIKHVVIGDDITNIGKYAFAECSNLETVELPDRDFAILNAAFEKCTNLKSIYRRGTDPIEGTIDLSRVSEIQPWTFGYDYLIANVILSENVTTIGKTAFEDNVNLAGIYGVPGSYAETYAADNGLTFYDASSAVPEPVQCTIPETTESTDADTEPEPDIESAPDSESDTLSQGLIVSPVVQPEGTDSGTGTDDGSNSGSSDGGMNIGVIIGIAAAAVVVIAVVVMVVLKNKKKQ